MNNLDLINRISDLEHKVFELQNRVDMFDDNHDHIECDTQEFLIKGVIGVCGSVAFTELFDLDNTQDEVYYNDLLLELAQSNEIFDSLPDGNYIFGLVEIDDVLDPQDSETYLKINAIYDERERTVWSAK